MIKATLVFGLESDTYTKIDLPDGKIGWNIQIGKNLLEDATKILTDVIAENYPNTNFYVDWIMGQDHDLSKYTSDSRPLTKYTVTMFDLNPTSTWSMKNIESIETQLNETFRNKFIYAYSDVDFNYPDGIICTACKRVGADCKICNGEKIITYESLLND